MAKIIKLGSGAKKSWIGKRIKCRDCHTVYELEAKDKPKLVLDPREGNYETAKCPVCKRDNYV